ncbi:MAG TPA: hypothetical protein PKV73_12800 [Agriterribacter sp.]|nr:hypothetical protein [Agriterribacter sp.]
MKKMSERPEMQVGSLVLEKVCHSTQAKFGTFCFQAMGKNFGLTMQKRNFQLSKTFRISEQNGNSKVGQTKQRFKCE